MTITVQNVVIKHLNRKCGFDLSQADGLKLEAELFGQAFESDDKTERVNAFIEKREAKLSGK